MRQIFGIPSLPLLLDLVPDRGAIQSEKSSATPSECWSNDSLASDWKPNDMMGAVFNSQGKLEFSWHGGLWVNMAEWEWENRREPCVALSVFILNMWSRVQWLLAVQDSFLYPGHHSKYQEGGSYESPKWTLISCLSCVRHWTEHIANRILLHSQNSCEGTEQLPSSLNRWGKLSLVTIAYLRAHYKWADLRPDSEASSLNQYTVLVFSDWT